MTKELSGRIAFVTGSGRGLGHAMATRLAEMGADIAIHDLDFTAPAKYGESADLGEVAKALQAMGVRTTAVTGNIGDPSAVAKMKTDIEATLGPVDILVNCAGGDIGAAGGKPVPNNVLGIPIEDIQALTANNLIGTMLMCQTFVPAMVAAGKGVVVNIASSAAHAGYSNGAIYATLKAAVVHYTRCLRRRGVGGRYPDQRGQPRTVENRAVSGDAHGRPGNDGFVAKVAEPVRRAGRDRRCGRVPRVRPQPVHQRPGLARRRRRDTLSRLNGARGFAVVSTDDVVVTGDLPKRPA